MSKSDIVEKLRSRAKSLRGMGSIAHVDADTDDEAADEINRLRAINADLVQALRDIEVCDIYGPVGIAVLKTKARVAIRKAKEVDNG